MRPAATFAWARRPTGQVRGLVLTLVLSAALLAGCGGERTAEADAQAGAVAPEALARAVTPQNLKAHLAALAAIGRRNDGTREVGTSGYQASVAYVTGKLRAAGYRPRLQSFSFVLFRETRTPQLERLAPGAKRYRRGRDFVTMRYSGGGAATARVAPVEFDSASSGCERSDFDGFTRGAVALVRRGECFLFLKARNAKAAGASAVLIANDGQPGRTAPVLGTLVQPGIGIPVLGVSSSLGAELARAAEAETVRVRIAVSMSTRRARAVNVIADLPGRAQGVVLLGAHLDSVAAGPGINDNGSGTALVLEVARQARRLGVKPAHGLRFAYVEGLSAAARGRISGVLNFDMVASPNSGRFVYDGDALPPGSARIEQLFRDYFGAQQLAVDELSLGGASDHAPFAEAGIPVGGLFTGADSVKPRDQARRFGGVAGQPYDACYHQPCDTLANVSVAVLSQMADAAAVVALRLAG
jgi:peptidase M28-like protein/PA domain-containing protein